MVEGELSDVGTATLTERNTRIGLAAGVQTIGDAYYLYATFEFDLRIGEFGFGVGTPLNLPVYDPAQGLKFFPDGFKPRPQDWDTWEKGVAHVLRYLTYGHKEGDIYVNFGNDTAVTIAHGSTVRRYLANINVDDARLTGELDAKFRYGGFELFVGDVVAVPGLVGALVYLRPGGGSTNLLLEKLSFGLTYTADWTAPLKVEKGASGYPVLNSTNDAMCLAPGCNGYSKSDVGSVHFVGASVETKVVKTENVDIKPYIDFQQMIVNDGSTKPLGNGLTLGMLTRLGFLEKPRLALRIIVEGRAFQQDYIPGYFDTFYEVQKYQYITNGSTAIQNVPTKLASIMSRPGGQWVPGVYGEVQFAVVNAFSVMAAAQYANVAGGTNYLFDIEVPTWSWIRLFASMYRMNVTGLGSSVGQSFTQQLFAGNTMIFAGARIKILPVLFINAAYRHVWTLDQTETTNSFVATDSVLLTAEVGYEFPH